MFGRLRRTVLPALAQTQLLSGLRKAQIPWRHKTQISACAAASSATFRLHEDCLGEFYFLIKCICANLGIDTPTHSLSVQSWAVERRRCVLTTCGCGITAALRPHTTPPLTRETWTLAALTSPSALTVQRWKTVSSSLHVSNGSNLTQPTLYLIKLHEIKMTLKHQTIMNIVCRLLYFIRSCQSLYIWSFLHKQKCWPLSWFTFLCIKMSALLWV